MPAPYVHRLALAAVLCFALGVAAYLFPPFLADPQNYRWLLRGDMAQHFLGWHFFRAEAWHWPPGALFAYGEEMSSSIVYTDSIPLLALLLKPASAVLPAHFQYAGLWVYLCFVLAAGLAWRCGWLATQRLETAITLAVFASVSSIMVARGLGHFALCGHWLLWWALGNYFQPTTKPIRWSARIACTCIAALVHAYLLFLVLGVYAAEWLSRCIIRRETTLLKAMVVALASAAALLVTLYLAGYFTLGSLEGDPQHYGRYAANLNSLFNSGGWSPLLPSFPVVPGTELEGGNYLGAGALLMILSAAILCLRDVRTTLRSLKSHFPLIAISTLFALMAFSHRVAWHDRVLLELPLPDRLLASLAHLRASGRLLWLPYYLLLLCAALFWARRFAPRLAALAYTLFLGLQAYDLYPFLSGMRETFRENFIANKAPEDTVLSSEFWNHAPRRYRRIAIAPMDHAARGWAMLGLYAADHGMSINSGQFARVKWERFSNAHRTLNESLRTGPLRDDTLYILNQPELLDVAHLSPTDGLGYLDGFLVLAPRWLEKHRCCLPAAREPTPVR